MAHSALQQLSLRRSHFCLCTSQELVCFFFFLKFTSSLISINHCDLRGRTINFANSKTLVCVAVDRDARYLLTCPNVKNLQKNKKKEHEKKKKRNEEKNKKNEKKRIFFKKKTDFSKKKKKQKTQIKRK